MRSSSVAALTCALCLTVPAAAGASQANGPPGATSPGLAKLLEAKGPYGMSPAAGSGPKMIPAKGSNGVTPAPGSLPKLVKAKGPYGMAPAAGSLPKLTAAKGPYGMTLAGTPQVVAATAAHHQNATGDGGTNGWRAAAISEAALFALLALGSTLLLAGRRRDVRLGM